MSARRALPTLSLAIAYAAHTVEGTEQMHAELRAAEAVIRAARRLEKAWRPGGTVARVGAAENALRRALARLDRVTGRDKR